MNGSTRTQSLGEQARFLELLRDFERDKLGFSPSIMTNNPQKNFDDADLSGLSEDKRGALKTMTKSIVSNETNSVFPQVL